MSRLQETIDGARTDWQRMVLAEWDRRNPQPARIKDGAGRGKDLDIVPTLCTCSNCSADAIIIPDPEIRPARGFVLCPKCSAQPQEGNV